MLTEPADPTWPKGTGVGAVGTLGCICTCQHQSVLRQMHTQ